MRRLNSVQMKFSEKTFPQEEKIISNNLLLTSLLTYSKSLDKKAFVTSKDHTENNNSTNHKNYQFKIIFFKHSLICIDKAIVKF